MNKDRFLVRAIGDDIEATTVGFVKILELLASVTEVVIVAPNAASVKGGMWFSALGDELAKKLTKDRQVVFNGKSIYLCYQATLKNFRHSQAYFALWGTKFLMEEIEALPNCKAVVLVTWSPEDSKEWEREHDVQVIYP